jgi:hypothetical protein
VRVVIGIELFVVVKMLSCLRIVRIAYGGSLQALGGLSLFPLILYFTHESIESSNGIEVLLTGDACVSPWNMP